jgi:hypothetical protein
LPNFLWNSTSYTCYCPTPYNFNGTASSCTCNTGTDTLINGTCVNCSTVLNNNGANPSGGSCLCISPYQWVWNSGNSTGNCICNSSFCIVPSAGSCLNCSTLSYAVGTVTNNTCDCAATYSWNSSSLTCSCSTDYNAKINGLCVNCSLITNSSGPNANNTGCQCVSPLQWYWNTSTLTGSCICNSTYEITSNGTCYNCSSLSYGTGAVINNTCVCLTNFLWNSTG